MVDLLVALGIWRLKKGCRPGHWSEWGRRGFDGIIKEDRLGLDVVYIQAKRWNGTVGRPVVQAFAGSLEGQRARKGIMIATSQFSQDARDYVGQDRKEDSSH